MPVFVQIIKYYEPQFENYSGALYSQRFLLFWSAESVFVSLVRPVCMYYVCVCAVDVTVPVTFMVANVAITVVVSTAWFHCSQLSASSASFVHSDLNCKLFMPAAFASENR